MNRFATFLFLLVSLCAVNNAQAFCIINESNYSLSIDQTYGHKKGTSGIGNKGLRTVKLPAHGRVCRNWKDKNTNERGDAEASLRFSISYYHPREDGPSIKIGDLKIPLPTSPPGMSLPSGGGRFVVEKVCEQWVRANGSLAISGKPGKSQYGSLKKGRWQCNTGKKENLSATEDKKRQQAIDKKNTYVKPKTDDSYQTQQPKPAAPPEIKIATPQVCSQDYNDCRNAVYQCKIQFKRDYRICEQDVARNYERCIQNNRSPLNDGRPFEAKICKQYKSPEQHCGPRKETHCGSYAICDNQLNYCQSKISQPYTVAPPPISPPPQFQPQPQPQPQPEKIRGYRVYIKNSCQQDVSVAYHYQSFGGVWITSAWQNLKPGQRVWPENLNTENSNVYIHSTIGWIKQRNGSSIYLPVINRPFKHRKGTSLKGDGLRTMPFHQFDWRASQLDVTANIVDCKTHQDYKKVAKKAPPKKRNDQAIFAAVDKKDWKTVRAMIKAGTPVKLRNVKSDTAQTLINAVSYACGKDTAIWLHKKGATLNWRTKAAPSWAFRELPKWEYSRRALRPFVKYSDMGELATAAWTGCSKLAIYFAKQHRSLGKMMSRDQTNVVLAAAYNADKSLIKYLQRKGVDLNKKDIHRRDAFHWLLNSPPEYAGKLIGIMKLLHKAGVELDRKDSKGNTPFLYAVRRGYVKEAKWLLEKGADHQVIQPGFGAKDIKALAEKSGNQDMINFVDTLLQKNPAEEKQ